MSHSGELPSTLASTGKTIIAALMERGVGVRLATDAAQAYINLLSMIYTDTSNEGVTLGRALPNLRVEPPEGDQITTRVFVGNREHGRVWVSSIGEQIALRYKARSSHGDATIHLE